MGAFHRALLVLCLASATEVAKVTKGNYDAFLQLAADEEQWVLLDFFAPWCGHCKRLNPVLDDFVADTPGVRVAKIDATAEKALAEAHDVDGYPTLRFRRAGSSDAFRDYKGARDAVGLAQLDARLRGPAVTTFNGALDDALTSVKFPPPVFVAAGRLPPDVEKAFAAVAASSYHMATFARLEAPDGALPADAVSAVEAGEWAHAWAPADDYEASLKAFCAKHNAPLFSELGPSNFRRLGKARLVVAAIVDPAREPAATGCANVARGAARTRAPDVRDAFVFGRLDGAKWDEYVATFGVTGADLPKILVIDLEGDKYYDDFSPPTPPADAPPDARDAAAAAALVAYLREVLAGERAAHHMGWRGFPDRAARFWRNHSTFVTAALGVLAGGLWLINYIMADDEPPAAKKRD